MRAQQSRPRISRRALIGSVAAASAAGALPAWARGRIEREKGMEAVLDQHDAMGLAQLVRDRQVSPLELLEAAIARTEKLNPQLNFLAQNHFDYGRAAIARGLPDGPFRGVPWLLKDLHIAVAGLPTENGSRLYRGYVPEVSSELVNRIEKAGFVIFGKTTSPEFGLTGTTESVLTGPTRNPWNMAVSAGGSSGGAAVAVAAGVLPAAHASDGGGSIRIPASCCGLFGLKPSRGRVPMGPPRTEGWGGLSVQHAITRSVRDSAAILDATHGVELGSRTAAPTPDGSFLSAVTAAPKKLRIALMLDAPSGSPVDAECVAAARAAAKYCEELGHVVEEAAPKLDMAAFGAASFAIVAASVAADVADRAAAIGATIGPDVLEPITLAFVHYGRTVDAMSYVRANNVLQGAAIEMAQFMERYDMILSPTLAAKPIELGRINLSSKAEFQDWGAEMARYSPFAQLENLTGQPAMSVPLGMSSDGLPIGVMFVGRYGDEAGLLSLAGQLERAASWHDRRPVMKDISLRP